MPILNVLDGRKQAMINASLACFAVSFRATDWILDALLRRHSFIPEVSRREAPSNYLGPDGCKCGGKTVTRRTIATTHSILIYSNFFSQ